jgi:hypothetical protein
MQMSFEIIDRHSEALFEFLWCPVCGHEVFSHIPYEGVFCKNCNTQVKLQESRETRGYEEAVLACIDTDMTWNLHVDEKLRRDLPDGSARVKISAHRARTTSTGGVRNSTTTGNRSNEVNSTTSTNLQTSPISRRENAVTVAVCRPLRGAGVLEVALTVGQSMTNTDTPWRDESLLYELYWEHERSTNDIADELDCDQATIWKWMERFEIPRRSSYEAATNRQLYPAVFTDRGYVICASNYRGSTASVGIHRLVMVAEHGFDAVTDKQVHHQNGIRFDNRPENLELLSRSEHARCHGFGTDIRPPNPEENELERERDERGRFK